MKKIFLIFITCLVIQFVLTGKWASFNDQITDLEKNISFLKEENDKVELQIASLVSISSIEERGTLAGFTKTAAKSLEEFSVALRR